MSLTGAGGGTLTSHLPSPCIPGIYIAVTRNHTEYARTR